MQQADGVKLMASQVAAAGGLHATLAQWRETDRALSRLQQAMPGFGAEEVLLKAVAVNALYGTNVFAIVRAAGHVHTVLGSVDRANAGPELIESLADVPTTSNGRRRRHVSFASKFAHFFISADRFPIYDFYAERMLVLHLGSSAKRNRARPYEAFVANIETLKRVNGLECSYRELDRYLWVAGLHRAYLSGERRINAELLRVFADPSDAQSEFIAHLGRGAAGGPSGDGTPL